MTHRVAGTALGLVLVAGCGLFVPSPPNGTESMPAPAGMVVTGEPEVAERQLELTLLRPDQPDFRRDITVAAGNVILADFGVSAGTYRLVGPGQACGLDVALAPETNTLVLLHHGSGGPCSFEVIEVDTSGY